MECKKNKLAIIIPCYNEEEILQYTIEKMQLLLENLVEENLISESSTICFINDGSQDKTQELIENICQSDKHFSYIKLAKNFGHQKALLAGMYSVNADMVVTIDADLQDNPNTIKEMVQKYNEGYEIVYGVRNKRTTDTFFKKYSALAFYKIMIALGVNIVYNHADFRLLSKNAIVRLSEYKEKAVFLRALVPLLGLKSCNVYYDRCNRIAGESKYPLFKMISFAWEGITSFSAFPLRLITLTGILIFTVSCILAIYACITYICGKAIQGWTSLMLALAFFNGIIILSIGIIGEYLNKMFIEVKSRPLYQIEKSENL
jgi:glycosyltransferase involved in cell wall biosynthesis